MVQVLPLRGELEMINFLVVDDIKANIEVLELIIVDYMDDNNIEEENYKIFKAKNGEEAVSFVEKHTFDMIFLDILMPIMNGFKALNIIREMKIPTQPIIVMATALGDEATKEKEKKGGANAYVVKPFGSKTINKILDHYLKKIIDKTISHDDFFEFDDMDEDGHTIDNQHLIMEEFNNSHKKLSTEELLSEYDYLHDEIHLDLEEIDCIVMNKFNLEEDTLDLDLMKKDLLEFFGLFSSFLHQFSEFDELSNAILSLKELIIDVELKNLEDEDKELLGIYIKAIIMDLIDWKEHVFVAHDAGDVFYANASLLSSYIEVKKLLQ